LNRIPDWVHKDFRRKYLLENTFMKRFFSDTRMAQIVDDLRTAHLSDRTITLHLSRVALDMTTSDVGASLWDLKPLSERKRIAKRFAKACRDAYRSVVDLEGMWISAYVALEKHEQHLAAELLKAMASPAPSRSTDSWSHSPSVNDNGDKSDDRNDEADYCDDDWPILILAKFADSWHASLALGIGKMDAARHIRAAVIHVHNNLEPEKLPRWANLTSRIVSVIFPEERELDEREVRRIVRAAKSHRSELDGG
jgi:hypothetical protein